MGIADLSSVFQMTVGLTIAAVVVPSILIFLIIRFRQNLAGAKGFSLLLVFGLAYGILLRFLIAPFTGHPQDLAYWTDPIRMFYESGIVDMRLYPMPFTYYPVLLSYSPYALLKVLGFQDSTFLAHSTGVLESLFVKLPFILADIFSVYFLYRILGKLRSDESISSRSQRLGYALLYFLSPVLILSSIAWPLVDGIAVALFLAGFYYSMMEEKHVLGGLLYTLSGLIKIFGFIGFVPLAISLLRRKKISKLSIIIAMAGALALLVYLPLFASIGIQGLPDFFMQFLKGRAGFGSDGFIASDSYFSYLSLLGVYFNSSYLTYLLLGLFALVTVYFVFKVARLDLVAQKERIVELSILYFASFFFLFYLIFYRVYNYYYLLVIPLLIMYSYRKNLLGPLFAAAFLSLATAPIFLLGSLVYGAPYYWISLNLPADTSIISVIPSTLAVLAFLSILAVRGPLKVLRSGWGMSVSAGIATWFSFGFAYYAYYGVPFLGLIWYPFSIVIALAGVVFFAKVFRRLTPEG